MPKYRRKKIGSRATAWLLIALPTAAMVALVMTAAPAVAEDLKLAAEHYSDSCADCHGASGKGDGPTAAALKTKPADYTDCATQNKFDDDYFFKIIKNGGGSMGKGKEMADYGKTYDDDEIHGMIAFIRSFCKK